MHCKVFVEKIPPGTTLTAVGIDSFFFMLALDRNLIEQTAVSEIAVADHD